MRASIAFLALLLLPSLGAADNEPWVLSANNWQEAQELLPAPVLERVKRGDYVYKIVPVDPAKFRANYSRRFWEASAANDSKYDLAPQVCGLADRSCSHHWAKNADDTYSAVANDLVIGVNDKSNTAAFGGRFTTHFLERNFPSDRFTIPALLRGGSD